MDSGQKAEDLDQQFIREVEEFNGHNCSSGGVETPLTAKISTWAVRIGWVW